MSTPTPTSTPTLLAEPGFLSVIWAGFLAPVLSGEEGVVRQIDLPSRADDVSFGDLGSTVADVRGRDWSYRILAGSGWTALVARDGRRDGTITVRATDLATVKAGVALFAERIPDAEPPLQDVVDVDFWQVSDDVYRRTRRLDAPSWDDIAGNYPDEVAVGIGGLLSADLDRTVGRLVLWHGPPGTGKTTALRALARAWAGRCRVQVLLDPEKIFASSGHLFEVLLNNYGDEDGWRLIVVEDADELIRADAKDRVGQALARLLNLSDGLLGQGVRVMTLITTNEAVERLHPALIRPGRCLSEVEFRAFTRAEARRRWPGRRVAGATVTLAEALHPVADGSPDPEPSVGLYL